MEGGSEHSPQRHLGSSQLAAEGAKGRPRIKRRRMRADRARMWWRRGPGPYGRCMEWSMYTTSRADASVCHIKSAVSCCCCRCCCCCQSSCHAQCQKYKALHATCPSYLPPVNTQSSELNSLSCPAALSAVAPKSQPLGPSISIGASRQLQHAGRAQHVTAGSSTTSKSTN